ncbi:iron-containing alcohol dehydrogenase, partial [Eubacteriales bacterium DFI.9.88]|nr:iron-containing alcohol dehydrogenase [Eubacteriales bacterium DFI.9.88]
IPTTSGTGAEVTGSAVINDTKRNLKYSFANENQIADVVIIDPELTYGMPPRATATVGLDALSHAIEVVVGTMQHDFAAPIALDAIDRIRRWLPIVYK